MTFKLRIAAALLAASVAAPAMAADELTFTIVNKTSEVITHFYTSPSNVEDWEEDVLGEDVIGPGESMQITIADGRRTCKYDLKFDFEGSTKLETTTDTQDLCEMSTYTLTE
jgi:hypothetical protein